jgi:hypothetical protein
MRAAKLYLAFHEWAAVLTVIGMIFFFAIIAYVNDPTEELLTQSSEVEVFITGAVELPGVYVLPRGSLIGDLLEKAQPVDSADLRRVKKMGKLQPGQVIHIKNFPQITIYLDGAVKKKGAMSIAKGVKIKDLLLRDLFLPEADLEPFFKNRFLRHQETLYIPYKKNNLCIVLPKDSCYTLSLAWVDKKRYSERDWQCIYNFRRFPMVTVTAEKTRAQVFDDFNEGTKKAFGSYPFLKKILDVVVDLNGVFKATKVELTPAGKNVLDVFGTIKTALAPLELINKNVALATSIRECVRATSQKVAKAFLATAAALFACKAVVDTVKFFGTFVDYCKVVLKPLHGIPVLSIVSMSFAGSGLSFLGIVNIIKFPKLLKDVADAKAKLDIANEWKEVFEDSNSYTDEEAIFAAKEKRQTFINEQKAKFEAKVLEQGIAIVAIEQDNAVWKAGSSAELLTQLKGKTQSPEIVEQMAVVEALEAAKQGEDTELLASCQEKFSKIQDRVLQRNQENLERCKYEERTNSVFFHALNSANSSDHESVFKHLHDVAVINYQNAKNERNKNIFDLVGNVVAVAGIAFGIGSIIASGFVAVPVAILVVSASWILASDSLGLTKYLVDTFAWEKKELSKFVGSTAAAAA